MTRSTLRIAFLALLFLVGWAMNPAFSGEGDKIRVLIIDGQHNRAWRDTTAFLKEVLEKK